MLNTASNTRPSRPTHPSLRIAAGLPIALVLFVFLAACPADAQDRWSFTLASGGALATQDLGDADLGLGAGFEAAFGYRFLPHLSAYAGWGWRHFGADDSFAGPDMDFEETGYTFGLQFMHPIANRRLSYVLQAGGIYNHIEAENADGDITGDSGHGLGWQAGAGVAFALSDHWQVVPLVRYRALAREIEVASVTRDVDLNYVSLSVGFTRTF